MARRRRNGYNGNGKPKRFNSKPKRRPKRKATGMKVKHKQWLTGAVAITAFFIAMPHIFSNILARVRGGA